MADLAFDLAFLVDPEVEPGGPWSSADPLIVGEGAEAAWSAFLRSWLEHLVAELPGHLRAPAYSLGLSLVDDASIADLNSTWRRRGRPTCWPSRPRKAPHPSPLTWQPAAPLLWSSATS
jgi:hypothetical protein